MYPSDHREMNTKCNVDIYNKEALACIEMPLPQYTQSLQYEFIWYDFWPVMSGPSSDEAKD